VTTPLFNWLDKRSAGVLLHPTALPGDFGIGSLGAEARTFIDFLAESGMSYWQICPLGPTGYGDSPYQSFSAFAGNPYLIDMMSLAEAGFIPDQELGPLLFLSSDTVDYGGIYKVKWTLLRRIFNTFSKIRTHQSLPYGDFEGFCQDNSAWLDSYAFFQALKSHFDGVSFHEWPKECLSYPSALKSDVFAELATEIEAHKFYQYLFFGQWKEIRDYANGKGVSIIGDIPLFVSGDSADLWANPDLFQLDKKSHLPSAVAGCPPDYFSEDGQLWGNPLYNWNKMKRDGFSWWKNRLAASFKLYDVLRLDHFRGFDTYWSIPADAETAVSGEWLKGPGLAFFKEVRKAFPEAKVIAEDLGELFPSVVELRDETGLPGMEVLQFAFGGEADNLYLPHNHSRNSVLYPGTHDNDTSLGWYQNASPAEQDHVRRYLGISGHTVAWDFIRSSYASVAKLCIIPFQDMLNLDSSARFNRPGEAQGNWSWRYRSSQLDKLRNESSAYLKRLATLYGR
jgi:4-alpha-glucanotransferase